MIKLITCLFISGACLSSAFGQAVTPPLMPFGKIDLADLEMKSCEFEKDANAEILFDKGEIYFDQQNFNVIMERHTRIKIFNDHGKDEANIRLEYYGGNRSESIYDLQAETINLADGKPEITKLDKKQLVTQNIDKLRTALIFSFPNIKSGSVIEYKYKETVTDIPDWFFQHDIPTRYSELTTTIPEMFYYKVQTRTREPYVKHTTSSHNQIIGGGTNSFNYADYTEVRAMANLHSLPDEPYMSSSADNLQCVIFQLASVNPFNGLIKTYIDSWPKIGGLLADDEDFGGQLKRKLNNEEEVVAKAKTFKTNDDKIAYIFNHVRDNMKWNDVDRWYTNDGTYRAWDKKTGNSTEINLILYHLLKQAGLKAYPMVVSTRNHGKVNQVYPFLHQFNRAVVYIPVDSTRKYILDASSKFNSYNEIPYNLLNSSGLFIDKENRAYDLIFINRQDPIRQVILVDAQVKAGGKMEGSVQINSFSYNRLNAIERYKKEGEKKYTDYLCGNDNNIKITFLKFEGMEVDTLPLTQKFAFNQELTGSDENYIYVNPNLFTPLKANNFLGESRLSDIDFGCQNSYYISGVYKIPPGYKADVLPKNISLVMPDKSIIFKRFAAEQDGAVTIRFVINYQKSIYFKETYPDFHEFFKKMNEMLNEQIVFKKS